MDSYPNVWPAGGHFGFSGVDGETRHDEPLVLVGRDDGLGWNFCFEPRPRLLVQVGEQRLMPRNAPTDFVLPDCWYCSARTDGHSAVLEGAFVDRCSIRITVAVEESDSEDVPDLFPVGPGHVHEDRTEFEGEGWWLVVCRSAPEKVRNFGIGMSVSSLDEANSRAQAALEVDIRKVISQRLGFYQLMKIPETVVDVKRRTFVKAASILKMNAESAQGRYKTRWFRSDPVHHRNVRPLDSVFHMLGLQFVHRELAHDAVRALFAGQQHDGMLPLSIGPGDREPDSGAELTHPPLVAWALCRLFDQTPDLEFMKWCYPRLKGYVNWFEARRKNENGLYGWRIQTEEDPVAGARGAESGMSNSPRFDAVERMTAVDLSSYMAGEYRALEIMAMEQELHEDAREWRARNRRIRDAVNELLWDSEDMFYYDLDEVGNFIPVMTTAGLMPMLSTIPDRDQAEALRTHITHPHEFWTPFPLASVSERESQYSKDMWRGATWPTMNVLVYHGLVAYKYHEDAQELAHKTVNEISYRYALSGSIFEYYDPAGKEEPGALPRKGAAGDAGGSGFGVIEEHQPTAAAYIYLTHKIAHPS